MKKTIGLVLLVTGLILALIFGYMNWSKSKALELELGKLSREIDKSNKDKADLADGLLALRDQLKESKSERLLAIDASETLKKELQTIDDQLQVHGDRVAAIKKLQSDNRIWREQLNAVTQDYKDVQAKSTELDENYEKQIDDLKAIVAFVDARIGELKEATNTLPKISLERIMIQQEVDFLETTRDLVQGVQQDL